MTCHLFIGGSCFHPKWRHHFRNSKSIAKEMRKTSPFLPFYSNLKLATLEFRSKEKREREREREREAAAMERTSTPVRKSHTSTAGLLTWTEAPPPDRPVTVWQNQPSDGVRKVVFGGQITEEEEAENILKRKPCSGPKLKEMTGSGIFETESVEGEAEHSSSFSTPTQRTSSRAYQQIKATSQISFSTDETLSPKKPSSLAEVAKQRELSGTLQSEFETKAKKQVSNAKSKELSGHDIFAPPEIKPRSLAARTSEIDMRDLGESNSSDIQLPSKLSKPRGSSTFLFGDESGTQNTKKINTQRVAELTGNDIFFKGDAPPGSAAKSFSAAKLKEMTGSDIFGDGKAPSRDNYGGIRKPPGGESSIALV